MNTNLDTITDLKELKSMAYDQIANKEQAENNLRAINTRISQILSADPALKDDTEKPSVSDEDLGIEDNAEEAD